MPHTKEQSKSKTTSRRTWLIGLLNASGKSKAGFARMVEIRYNVFVEMTRGTRHISDLSAARIAKALGVGTPEGMMSPSQELIDKQRTEANDYIAMYQRRLEKLEKEVAELRKARR